jgi:DNA adenine methylase
MKAPFVWFGGKRRVAPQVWEALGDVDNYIEPFAGSLAVLLGRPESQRDKLTETVNDADGFVANFWRALSMDPEAVAAHADYPVNEIDLFARHLWLVNTGRSRLLNGLESDPEWFDPQIAGWWVWGVNSWIGSGWCSGDGPWVVEDDLVRKLPHLGDAGRGVNRQLPHLGNAGRAGFWTLENRRTGIVDYFLALADRLRDTRVCCGDWSRVVTNGATSFGATVGVFLDPPYLGDVRTADLYAVDDHSIANEVRGWCLLNGDNPRMRIVLAGYLTEHDHLMPDTWRRVRWSSSAAYSTTASAARSDGNHNNRHLECLWLSPHCIDPATATPTLFDGAA